MLEAHTRAVEIGVRGFVAKSTITLQLDFGLRGRSLKGVSKKLSEAAEAFAVVNQPELNLRREILSRCLLNISVVSGSGMYPNPS